MAYIEKRNGKWRAKVSWNGVDGKRHTKSKQGFETKRQAMQWSAEMEVAKGKKQISNQDPVFADYYLDWMKTYRLMKLSEGSKSFYLNTHKHVSSFFKAAKISRITRRDYQEFVNKVGSDHSKSYMQIMTGFIRSCVQNAIDDGLIYVDFTKKSTMVWNDKKTRKVEYLSIAEIKRLISTLEDGIKPSQTARYMILTAIYTGMRIGEITALKWPDIDFDKHVIKVNSTYDERRKQVKKPKTSNSIRTIRVSEDFLNELRSLKINRQSFVFANVIGELPTQCTVNNNLRKYLKLAGITKRGFHFHSLRHSHVALLLYHGVSLYAISKRLGHANMTITSDTYAYLIDELRQQSDDHIEQILDELSN